MKDFAAVFSDGSTFQAYLLVIATVGSLLTPIVAYMLRSKRAKRPRTPSESLYAYYENYINVLLAQAAKKDKLIDALYVQIRDQRTSYEKIISDLEHKLDYQREVLDDNQTMIDQLRNEVMDLQQAGKQVHEHLQELKSEVPDAPPSDK